MTATIRRTTALGLAALAAAFVAAAATIPTPVKPTSSPAVAARFTSPGQEALDFDAEGFSALRQVSNARIENFPVAPGVLATLVVKRFEVLSADAHITVTGENGDTTLPFPSIAHFSGRIEGDSSSRVYVAAQEDRLVAYLRSDAGTFYVGPDESERNYVVRASDSPLNDAVASERWTCAQDSLPAALTAMAEPSFPVPATPLAGLKQAAARVETDHQLYVHFLNDPNAVANYAATLFGAINTVYESELALHLAIAEVHVWAAADPYTGSDPFTQLQQLGDWWHVNRPMATYPRAFVHYLSGHPVTGGVAWIGVLCQGDFSSGGHYGGAYGLTQVNGVYPLSSWDQFASAHEIGHNAGSPHTHCMGPAPAPYPYPTWTDQCYSGEVFGGASCYSGATSVPAGKGTIMSYCHLIGPGYFNNDNFVFHSRCINDLMLPEIASASCLTAASTFLDVPPSHPFFSFVETLVSNGVTSGCALNYYCPNNPVTRAQMAVFLLLSKNGQDYTPPPATGTVFADVHANDFGAAWIEELSKEGITGGCNVNPLIYCPNNPVTRAQMAVFLLLMEHGSAYTPASCSGKFTDVACTPNPAFAVNFIEKLYSDGVTGGCNTNPRKYCPNDAVTRGQMAVFLVTAFGLVP